MPLAAIAVKKTVFIPVFDEKKLMKRQLIFMINEILE